MSNYYIAINDYRSSADDGFGNTWITYICTREQQQSLLTRGLPVQDQRYMDGEPCHSTRGIRLATRAERRQLHKRQLWGESGLNLPA